MSHAPDDQVLRAIERFGVSVAAISPLSPLGSRKGRRLAYRVDGRCGNTFKVRHFESDEAAAQIMSLRAHLPACFAPVIDRHGPVLIEQWVDGRELCSEDTEFAFGQGGAILGRLHSDSGALGQEAAGTDGWLETAYGDIRVLETAGIISTDQAAGLRGTLADTAPRVCRTSLIHYDFCGENMLIDARGELRIIDNEQLTIAPTGLDLAWTCFRWPGASRNAQFREAYEASAGAVPAALDFWRTVALLIGNRVYLQCAPGRLDDTLPPLLDRIDAAPTGGWPAP